MNEPFGPESAKPAPVDCPDCLCCSVALCERGRITIRACAGCTPAESRPIVANCPCSSEETRGTAAWRAARYRVTTQATGHPVQVDVEAALRAVAAGDVTADMAEQIAQLVTRRFVEFEESRPVMTHLGARYLEARDEHRFRTPVEVELVDIDTRTARVIVVGWSLTAGVTVLLDQLLVETQLEPGDLVGKFLEAEVNCRAVDADDLVLTRIGVAPPLPPQWQLKGDSTSAEAAAVVVEEQGIGGAESGRVDGAPAGGA
ncbi:hypothetical protein [Streptomyces anulatus]|uniref:hypothetical protein n=1 Tax=Streptomyces anulatus TaxID=1892 RepID=UPI003689B796